MKKIIYSLIIPLLFITRVHAEGLYAYPDFYNSIDDEKYVVDNLSTYIDNAISQLNSNYYGQYSDYVVLINTEYTNNNGFIIVYATTSNVFYHSTLSTPQGTRNTISFDFLTSSSGKLACYFQYKNYGNYVSSPDITCGANNTLGGFHKLPIKTSRDFIYYNSNIEATLEIPSFTDTNFNFPSYTIGVDNVLPTYETLVNNDYVVNPNASFVNINLKNYDYIVLSLKNYNVSALNTPIYTLGSLCITRVNNYGMTEISTTSPSYKTPSCSDYYASSTPVNLYVDGNMLSSKPVWYIKSPSDERPNTISVNSDIFNISYIDSSNRDNPTVVIGGRDYPVIPYDNLTDTAIISTNEGYISGEVCSPFDNDCILNQNNIDSFDDIFEHPLLILKSVWTSIVSVFGVISAFLMLLPVPLQTFLYLSFMLAIILGILKILL